MAGGVSNMREEGVRGEEISRRGTKINHNQPP